MITINPASKIPLHRQVYLALRDQILRGDLPPGTSLPSTRSLAGALNLSRNVTVLAYEQLLADGLVTAAHGSGTTVAGRQAEGGSPAPAPVPPRPSSRGAEEGGEPANPPPPNSPQLIDFRSGLPDCEAFPRSIWGRLYQQSLRDMPATGFGYGPVAGLPALREAVAAHLAQTRGVRTSGSQVIITSGATQALSLLASLLIRAGDMVVCENPSHPVIRSVIEQFGARVLPAPVDEHGIQVERLPALERQPRLIYLTPSHQFPSGAVLETGRRHALVALARATGATILEDDYDSEIRHSGPPLPALQGLAPEHVVYVGSFSKTLAPTLRVGYAILPVHLVHAFTRAKFTADYHSPGIEQHVLAAFIQGGHLQRHLARMRRLYRNKRATLIAALDESFGGRARCRGDATGLHLWLELESRWTGPDLARAAAQRGVGVYSLSDYWSSALPPPPGCHLILGYGGLSPEAIREGVRILAEVERSGTK